MEIVTTTTITLSDEEKAALQTIKEARDECIRKDFIDAKSVHYI